MCGHYIPSVGYVCYECQNEFKKFAQSNLTSSDDQDIIAALKIFIDTPKDMFNNEIESDIERFFNYYES